MSLIVSGWVSGRPHEQNPRSLRRNSRWRKPPYRHVSASRLQVFSPHMFQELFIIHVLLALYVSMTRRVSEGIYILSSVSVTTKVSLGGRGDGITMEPCDHSIAKRCKLSLLWTKLPHFLFQFVPDAPAECLHARSYLPAPFLQRIRW